MGAAPSILTVPSTAIAKDIEALKALCPSRFRVEKPLHDTCSEVTSHTDTSAVLTAKDGSLTIILVAIPVAAANRLISNRVTFVLPETELRSVVNRCEGMRLLTNKVTAPRPPSASPSKEQLQNIIEGDGNSGTIITMAEFNLPGGAGAALVSPSMLSAGMTARQELGQKLAQSLLESLPKGVARTKSICNLNANSRSQTPTRTISTTAAASPERRQSLGSMSRSGDSPRTGVNNTNTSMRSPRHPQRSISRGHSQRTLSPSSRSNHQKQRNKFKSTPTQDATSSEQNCMVGVPSFPTLKLSALYLNGKYNPDFYANSRVPIRIETELFVGQVVFVMRPPSEADSFWNERVFANKNRRLVMQLQGKFKYEPKGIVYAGLEAAQELRLGRLSKGLSGLLLKWAEKKNADMYHSFGDDKEKARIVVPAQTFFDRLVVTRQGYKPPNILEPLVEGKEEMELRMRLKQTYHFEDYWGTNQQDFDIDQCGASEPTEWTWNINDTYSMSLCTSNLDLPTWSLLDAPQLGDVGLKALVGNCLRFVMYDNQTPPEKATGHTQHYLRYAYAIQLKHLGQQQPTNNSRKAHSKANTGETILEWVEAKPGSTMSANVKEVSHDGTAISDEKENDTMALKQSESDKFPPEERETEVLDDKEYEEFLKEASAAKQSSIVQDLRPKLSSAPFDDLAVVDTLCPAWIEMCASQGKYTRAYAFNVNGRTVFRTPKSFRDLIRVGNYLVEDVSDASMDNVCSPRMSDAERTRRLFGKMLEVAMKGQNADSLKRMMELYSSQFLRRRETSFPAKNSSSNDTGGIIARALSDRHWIEEWTEISANSISFAHPDTRKRHFVINMECVVGVRYLERVEAPIIHNCLFMAVETLGRTTYIMFASEADRSRCFDAITNAAARARSKTGRSKANLFLDSPKEEFTRKCTMWSCGDRFLLNTRQMSFRAPLPFELLDPLEVVEEALKKALHPEIEHNDDVFQAFLNCTSKLKNVCVNSRREEYRLTFFLNLYHLMVTHAALVLGVADSQDALIKNFSCVSYQTCDDIISISELEHCILRNRMTRLAPVVSCANAKTPPAINSRLLKATSPFRMTPPVEFRYPIPSTNFCFALQKADFRINFAINCGSTSNPSEVIIYNIDALHEQLEEASKMYLHKHIAINKRNKHFVCVLPRLCQWFADDFGSTNYSVLKTLEPYLTLPERRILDSPDFTSLPITTKYFPFSFDCRKLVTREERFRSYNTGMLEADSYDESTSTVSAPGTLTMTDAPTSFDGETDMESLLDFLMDDALEIPSRE